MPLLEAVGEIEERVAVEPFDRLDDQVDAVLGPHDRLHLSPAAAPGRLALQLLARLLELGANGVELARATVEERPRLARRDGFDPARAGADGALREDRERPDLGGRAHVRAAAELARDALDLDDADDVAVLLAEQHHRAELARLVDGRLEDVQRVVLEDGAVDPLLDLVALLGGQLPAVREVEPELVGTDGRAGLLDVVAEHLAESLLEQVRGGVVRHRREADAPRDDRADAAAGGEAGAAEHEHLVVADPVRLHELGARRRIAVELDDPLVGDLAAAGRRRTATPAAWRGRCRRRDPRTRAAP